MSEWVKNISDNEFDREVLHSETPVLVDFWAVWCAPCKAIAPTVDALSEQYKDRVKFCKVNVDDNSAAPSKYGVRGIPTLILFKKGEVADQLIGAASKETISAMIDKAL